MTDHYTYRITWSPEDGEHVGLCVEFPSLRRLIELRFPTPSRVQFTVPVTVELASMRRPPSPGNSIFAALLSWLASTQSEALSGITELVRSVLADMQANGEPPPEPLADRSYSGRFVVRVPPETHRDLVLKAAEEGVSLNRLVSARLAG